jgi:hypothetical protein
MKFHDPGEEAGLLNALRLRRQGRALERQPWSLEGWPGTIGFFLVAAFMLAMLVCSRAERPIGPGWQMLMVGAWFTFEAVVLHGSASVERHPNWGCLLLLPVSGTTIGRWIRHRVIVGSWTVLVRAGVAAWALRGTVAGQADVAVIIGHALALWLVTIATAALLGNPLLLRLRVSYWWGKGSGAFLALGMLDFWTHEAKSEWLHPHLWMEKVAPWIAATFPPGWLGSTVLTWPSILVVLAFSFAGVRRWIEWPRLLGAALDQPQDLFGGVSDEDELEEGEEDSPPVGEGPALAGALAGQETGSLPLRRPLNNSDVASALHAEWRDLPEVFAGDACGWIERLALCLLGSRGREIAPMLLASEPGWSAAWRRALWIGLGGILLGCIARAILPQGTLEIAMLWICLPQAVMFFLLVLPLSNGLSRVTHPFPAGAQKVPVHMLLPVTARDLLRVSWCVTCARALAALPLVAMIGGGNALAFLGSASVALMVAKAGCGAVMLVVLQRPLLIVWRINETTRWVWWHQLAAGVVFAPLVLASLVLGVSAFVTLVASSALVALGLFVLQGAVNYGIFLLYRQTIRRSRIDFLRQQKE